MLKKIKRNWKVLSMFILGFFIAIYPIVSNKYYTIKNNNQIRVFEEAASGLSKEEVDKRIDLAKAYNETLDPSRLTDPYTEREKEGVANYARMLELKEQIGFINIPKIEQKLPVFAGTSEEVLQKAAGHLEGTSLPIGGKDTHAVITAHRGLPKVKLFRDLDKLDIGDVFYYTNVKETMAYEVDQVLTIEPWNFDPVLVVDGKDYMSLLTCTPYMINSHRLLVRGHRIPYVESSEKEIVADKGFDFKTITWLGFVILIIIFIFLIKWAITRRKNEKKN
ncbi:sortase family protein [Clostridiales bacterium KA00134]|nr:sortase family protein [Clostridiales bacterium KA00134]